MKPESIQTFFFTFPCFLSASFSCSLSCASFLSISIPFLCLYALSPTSCFHSFLSLPSLLLPSMSIFNFFSLWLFISVWWHFYFKFLPISSIIKIIFELSLIVYFLFHLSLVFFKSSQIFHFWGCYSTFILSNLIQISVPLHTVTKYNNP